MQASDLPKPVPVKETVSPEAWAEWLQHPTTKIFRSLLLMRREELKEQLAEGIFTDASSAGNQLLYGRAIGGAKCLLDLLELEAVTVNQELDHGE